MRHAKDFGILPAGRATLRPLRQDDLYSLHEAMSDPEVMRYWSHPPHTELAQTEHWLALSLAQSWCEFVIEHEHQWIGRIGFWKSNDVGFFLLRKHWRKGLAQEALAAACAYGFSQLGFLTITADVDPRNARSLRLLQRIGFQQTGTAERTWRVGDEWCDSVYLSLRPENLPGS